MAPPTLGLVPLAILPALGDLMEATALETFLTRRLVLALGVPIFLGVLVVLNATKEMLMKKEVV
mgnify:CR=1 FL=1